MTDYRSRNIQLIEEAAKAFPDKSREELWADLSEFKDLHNKRTLAGNCFSYLPAKDEERLQKLGKQFDPHFC